MSIFPIISKLFEKIISKELPNRSQNILPDFQCGFRKGFNIQHCLLKMIEKWEAVVDNKVFGAFLTDLSNAFHCVSHDLLTANLNVFGL